MEILSVLLAFYSIVQNMTNKTSHRDMLKGIKDALVQIDKFYTILRDAKRAHDSFESLELTSYSYMKAIGDGRVPASKIPAKMDFIDKMNSKFVDLFTDFTHISIDKSLVNPTIPQNTILTLEKIEIHYNFLMDTVSEFTSTYNLMLKNHKIGNYGHEFMLQMQFVYHQLETGCGDADKVILNTCSIIDLLHSKIKEAVWSV
jgi:hypothetical protein